MKQRAFKTLEKRIRYRFKKPALLEAALTHPSFRYENPDAAADNQRLEFLGDAVLGLLAADILMTRNPQAAEGELTKLKSAVTSGSALAAKARLIGLGEHLRLGKGEAASGGADRGSNLEDALEALLGAIWLDGGLKAARKFFENTVFQSAENSEPVIDNPKGMLQEYAQKKGYPVPDYQVLEASGPDHARRYCVEVTVSTYAFRGEGTSRREAEKMAAEKAVKCMIQKD
ncbi:MAG TPA: ribonuclease III [Pontiellaceae bacterium]|nr:ribonuclease III [Pontiellaceae bacterium]HPR82585.1 ribonuclease III [Pontiellaceae bacterium]